MERPWRVPIAWDVSRLVARIHIFPQLKLVLFSINKVALFLYLFNEKVLEKKKGLKLRLRHELEGCIEFSC